VQKCYSKKFKVSVFKKMMPPGPVSVSQICRETGVSDVTLYKWRKSVGIIYEE
jgi:transposase